MLVAAGSGLLTGGVSGSAGISASVVADIFVAPYNSLNAVRQIVDAYGDDIAAVIVEPIAGNMGLVEPRPGFLEGLRDLSSRCGALLVFDEVITGFRMGATTYGELCGIKADLTTLGKIIGGGMPIGAVGGNKKIMESLAPLGSVYQAGTLSGNPVAVAAGMTTLQLLLKENPYTRLNALAERLAAGVNRIAVKNKLPIHCVQTGSLFTPFFRHEAVRDLADSKACDNREHARFFHHMLDHGIYTPPSSFELNFISASHSDEDIEDYIEQFAGFAADS
jgi:glutamate-1-semialdehyde 2,1-aminomutase